jgi:hypothetical protein
MAVRAGNVIKLAVTEHSIRLIQNDSIADICLWNDRDDWSPGLTYASLNEPIIRDVTITCHGRMSILFHNSSHYTLKWGSRTIEAIIDPRTGYLTFTENGNILDIIHNDYRCKYDRWTADHLDYLRVRVKLRKGYRDREKEALQLKGDNGNIYFNGLFQDCDPPNACFLVDRQCIQEFRKKVEEYGGWTLYN